MCDSAAGRERCRLLGAAVGGWNRLPGLGVVCGSWVCSCVGLLGSISLVVRLWLGSSVGVLGLMWRFLLWHAFLVRYVDIVDWERRIGPTMVVMDCGARFSSGGPLPRCALSVSRSGDSSASPSSCSSVLHSGAAWLATPSCRATWLMRAWLKRCQKNCVRCARVFPCTSPSAVLMNFVMNAFPAGPMPPQR